MSALLFLIPLATVTRETFTPDETLLDGSLLPPRKGIADKLRAAWDSLDDYGKDAFRFLGTCYSKMNEGEATDDESAYATQYMAIAFRGKDALAMAPIFTPPKRAKSAGDEALPDPSFFVRREVARICEASVRAGLPDLYSRLQAASLAGKLDSPIPADWNADNYFVRVCQTMGSAQSILGVDDADQIKIPGKSKDKDGKETLVDFLLRWGFYSEEGRARMQEAKEAKAAKEAAAKTATPTPAPAATGE